MTKTYAQHCLERANKAGFDCSLAVPELARRLRFACAWIGTYGPYHYEEVGVEDRQMFQDVARKLEAMPEEKK